MFWSISFSFFFIHFILYSIFYFLWILWSDSNKGELSLTHLLAFSYLSSSNYFLIYAFHLLSVILASSTEAEERTTQERFAKTSTTSAQDCNNLGGSYTAVRAAATKAGATCKNVM